MPSLPQPLSRVPPSDAWACQPVLDTHHGLTLCWRGSQLRRPCVFSGIRSSPAVAFLVPSMDSPMWDLGPRLSPESVTDSAQAVGAHTPVPDLLLWVFPYFRLWVLCVCLCPYTPTLE